MLVLGGRGAINPVMAQGRGGGAGAIDPTNVVEYVENPAQGQLYAGGTLSSAWTLSIRTNLASVPTNFFYLAFDSQSGRFAVGLSGANNGIFVGSSWQNRTLFVSGDHTYMIVQSGSSIQCYRDAVAIGAAISGSVDIGGTTRYRTDYSATLYPWLSTLRAAHIANIALSADQRTALHATLMAL